jgi:hypothetical protein
MIIETAEFVALSDVMSAKKMKEMADEISRLESEVDMWKESAQSFEIQVSMLRKDPIHQCYDGCLVLSYDKLRDTLFNIDDFNLSCSFSTILQQCLPSWATEEDTDKVTKLVPFFPKEIETSKAIKPLQKIPDELMTEEAIALKEKLMDSGLVDEDWQPVDLSWSESALMAQMICESLSIKDTWRIFGLLWNKKSETLRGFYNRSLDQKKTLVFQDRLKEII